MKTKSILCAVMTLMLYPPLAISYVVTDFGPTTYDPDTAAMDAALGITGYVVEDFEDTELLPEISISTDKHPTPMSTIEIMEDTAGSRPWDGAYSLHNATLLPDPPGID